MSDITFQPIEVIVDGGHRDGQLALVGGRLVAVLVHVTSDETQSGKGEAPEGWYQEAGFGPCSELVTPQPPMFASLEDARGWIHACMNARRPR